MDEIAETTNRSTIGLTLYDEYMSGGKFMKVPTLPELEKEFGKEHSSKQIESAFWLALNHSSTPESAIETREFDDNEYVKEFYIKDELDRLFPGWWQDGMETVYISEIKTWKTTGYLFVEYSIGGKTKIRKIYAVGASEVQPKKEDKRLASKPDDVCKASLTEWFKIAGKRLGIALDIYSQEITAELMKKTEDFLRGIPTPQKDNLIGIIKTITKASKLRKWLKRKPDIAQISRFTEIVTELSKIVPDEKIHTLWDAFLNMGNQTEKHTNQINDWLSSLETKIK